MNIPGKLYLIPCYLSESNDKEFIAPIVVEIVQNTTFYLVENIRTARRFISSLGTGVDISTLVFTQMDKDFDLSGLEDAMKPLHEGVSMGYISEAGLPAVADPGSIAVSYAHKNGIPVCSLPGASAIMMALTSSGFNGQMFVFHGYLPVDKVARLKAISKIEKDLKSTGYTQLFMETPYRNDALFNALLDHLSSESRLFIGADLSGKNEICLTKTVSEWRKQEMTIGKIPALFAIGTNS